MSALPKPPLRRLKKNSVRPSSDKVGAPSPASLLIGAPRFAGVSQSQGTQLRCDTQMSLPPSPPGRADTKYKESPSGERAALPSSALELITEPRFTGSDQI